MQPLYRIYDTIEKIHRNDMFVWVNWLVYETRLLRLAPTKEMWEYITVISEAKNQSLYIVERCTLLYDKNKVLIYENDIITNNWKDKYAIILDKAQYIAKNINVSWSMLLSLHTRTDIIEVIGHALRDSHLLSDK